MSQLSRQDVQQVIDNARNRILDRAVTKQDVQSILDVSRDRVMNYMHDLVQVHQQNLLRRSNSQNADVVRRLGVLENRMQVIDQELRITIQLLQRLVEQQPSRISTPAMFTQGEKVPTERQYNYQAHPSG